jgi:hypothetical protein
MSGCCVSALPTTPEFWISVLASIEPFREQVTIVLFEATPLVQMDRGIAPVHLKV